MNIKQVQNPRMTVWMKHNNLTETPKSFHEYMAFINNAVTIYTKENQIRHIIDHDDFTTWLEDRYLPAGSKGAKWCTIIIKSG